MASVSRIQNGPPYNAGPESRPHNTTAPPADISDDYQIDYSVNRNRADLFQDVDTNLNTGTGAAMRDGTFFAQQQANLEAGRQAGVDREIETTRKARTPAVKLDEERLLSPKGIPALRGRIKKCKLKGKGHEFEDARRLLEMYQLWLDDLFPKAKFRDALAMVEKLGHTRQLQIHRKAWIEDGKPKPVIPDEPMDDFEAGTPPLAAANDDVEATGSARDRSSAGADQEVDMLDDDINSMFVPENPVPLSKKRVPQSIPDDLDELDALLAEDAEIRKHNGLGASSLYAEITRPRSPGDRDLDEDMELMREFDM